MIKWGVAVIRSKMQSLKNSKCQFLKTFYLSAFSFFKLTGRGVTKMFIIRPFTRILRTRWICVSPHPLPLTFIHILHSNPQYLRMWRYLEIESFADVTIIIKMMPYWNRVGFQSNMAGSLWRGETWTQTHTHGELYVKIKAETRVIQRKLRSIKDCQQTPRR